MFRWWQLRVRFLCVAALMLAASACSDSSADDPAATATPAAATDAAVPRVVSARVVCSLVASNPAAASVRVTGADGAQSVLIDGTTTWFFGDTVRETSGGRRDVIHAAVATSNDRDASDCVDLAFKHANGEAQPLFPRREETTAWPDGVLALDDGSIAFYMVKAIRESPFSWHVGSVGLGRVAAGTTTGERVTETIWDENSGFGSRIAGVRSPIRIGDDVIVYIRTDDGGIFAARAPIARMAERDAYEYRAGDRWMRDPADAEPMWPVERGAFPADNGVQVSRDPASGEWIALYNGELASVRVRTAPEPWGPWSEPVTWLDCRPAVGERYPYCYSSEIHAQYDANDGRTRYLTISSQEPYDVTLLEVTIGIAVREWTTAGGAVRYAIASPGDGWQDRGVAFWASDAPAPGLVPVYERIAEGAATYTLDAPDASASPAFYAASAAESGALVPLRPVYRWTRNGLEVLDIEARPGFERGDIAFWSP